MKRKVLIIDDNEELLMLVEIIFLDIGYEIIGTADSTRAFEYAVKEKPDIIILDIMMPRMSGWDVLKQIKSNNDTEHIPVLMLSVKADRDEKEKSRNLGADTIMRKPFQSEELIEAVTKIIEEKNFK